MSVVPGAVVLSDEQLETLADLIADRLRSTSAGELIDAAELASRISRSRDFVYEHAALLDAVRIGDGPRPRLMFRWPQVLDRLAAHDTPAPKPPSQAPRSRKRTTGVELLPIGGKSR